MVPRLDLWYNGHLPFKWNAVEQILSIWLLSDLRNRWFNASVQCSYRLSEISSWIRGLTLQVISVRIPFCSNAKLMAVPAAFVFVFVLYICILYLYSIFVFVCSFQNRFLHVSGSLYLPQPVAAVQPAAATEQPQISTNRRPQLVNWLTSFKRGNSTYAPRDTFDCVKLGPELGLCNRLTLSDRLLDVAQNLRATKWGVKQLPEPLSLPVSVCATHPIAAPCTWTLWGLEYCSRGCFWSLLVHRTPAFKDFNFSADGRGEPVWSLVNICVRHPAAKLIGSELQSDFRIVIILALAVVVW